MRPLSRFLATVATTTTTPSEILSHITPETAQHLLHHGYAVQDSILPTIHATNLLSEIAHLVRTNRTTPNLTHLHTPSTNHTRTFQKRSVEQCELSQLPPHAPPSIPTLRALHADPSLPALLSVYAPPFTLRDMSVKVQRAAGCHAAFPIHLDACASQDARLITALLYPHDWPCDARGEDPGGALRLYVSPLRVVDIPPRSRRLVLLSSRLMHHRVLPTARERVAITLWLSGSLSVASSSFPPHFHHWPLDERVAYVLLQPRFRDFVFRIVLHREWVQSLRDAHPPREVAQLLRHFENALALIRNRLPPVVVQQLRLEKSDLHAVQALVAEAPPLVDAYNRLEERLNALPFFW